MLTKSSRLSAGRTIFDDLVHRLDAGEFAPGGPFPTEQELMALYGVGRGPVRQAVTRLEAIGRVERTAGRGTVVLDPKVVPFARLSGFFGFYKEQAVQLASRTLSVETVPADPEVASHLRVAAGSPVLLLRRLRMVGETPVAYNQNFLAPAFGRDTFDHEGDWHSIRQFLSDQFNVTESVADEVVKAALPTPEVAEAIGVQVTEPLLFVTRTTWDRSGQPVAISRYWVRSEIMPYRSHMSTEGRA